MTDDKLTTIDPDHLQRAHGGGWLGNAWNTIKETFGYAGPAGASEAAAAIPAAAGVAMLAPQAKARNNLIRSLASPTSSNAQINGAFDKYNNGPQRKLLKHIPGG
jgi:hypothetical protein